MVFSEKTYPRICRSKHEVCQADSSRCRYAGKILQERVSIQQARLYEILHITEQFKYQCRLADTQCGNVSTKKLKHNTR